jgi:hypothetical protein
MITDDHETFYLCDPIYEHEHYKHLYEKYFWLSVYLHHENKKWGKVWSKVLKRKFVVICFVLVSSWK